MKVLIDLLIFSENPVLKECLSFFSDELLKFKVEFQIKGEERKKYKNEALRYNKNTVLTITCDNSDYHTGLRDVIAIRKKIISKIKTIEQDDILSTIYINYFIDFTNDYLSIDFGVDDLELLINENLGLPISVYQLNTEKEIMT